MLKFLQVSLISLFFALPSVAQQVALQRFVSHPCMKYASIGVSVIRLSDGKEVAAWHPEQALVPASTLKVLTTATALRRLGADYRITTTLEYSGVIKDSILHGKLFIRGGGDPALGSRYDKRERNAFFEGMLNALRNAGIKQINQELVGDDRALPEEGVMPGWSWEDLGNYYAAGIYGLNFGDNMFEIVLDTSCKGIQPTVKSMRPNIPGLKINNRLLPRPTSFDSAYLYGAPYASERYLYGAVPQSGSEFTIKGDLPDPPLQTAQFARDYLVAHGIICKGNAVSAREYDLKGDISEERKVLWKYYSQPLAEIARQTNVHSLNLYAEGLLRQIAPSAPVAIEQMVRYWKKRGLDTNGLFIYDGSGLSPSNRLTAGFLSGLMYQMRADEIFVKSLPVAGKEGTVSSFLKNSVYSGKARLKSGSIKQVVAYTGYIDGKDKYAVSILVNNATCSSREVRKAIEKLLTEMSL
ncbi:MAG: D-alanyl-D-alanine carboxypeptidase/D-alanyl-D-alanine-endopeptidase [Bacteroidales bacterium]